MERRRTGGPTAAARQLWRVLDDRSASGLDSTADARRAARRRLPALVFDFVDGGADDEVTMRRNDAAFEGVAFRPRMASGMFEPSIGVTVLGTPLGLPVLLAPCGLTKLLHPDGPAGVARAAAARGTVSVLSTMAGVPVDEVAREARVPMWFQLYAAGGRKEAVARCELAAAAGVEVLVVTVDTPVLGNRTRDVRNGVSPPLRLNSHNAVPLGVQVLRRPRWAAQLATTGIRFARQGLPHQGLANHGGMDPASQANTSTPVGGSPLSWDDVAYLRGRWSGPLVVKGVLSGSDARHAIGAGADAVVVSNHGGRQLDGAPATLDVLPEVVDAVGKDGEVLVDGGVRRGSHVVAALALGARAVMIGRPHLYALAVGGEVGVERLLQVLEAEMRRTMVLLGCRSVGELDPSWLTAPRS